MKTLLLIIFPLLIGPAASQAQLPGSWEKIYICDTCHRPYAIFADEDAVLVMKGDISTEPPRGDGWHYTTYTSLDTGHSWAEAKVFTKYTPLEASNFNVSNFVAPNPTDDRRGSKPTCTMFCGGQIFASFNAGTNWDHTLHFQIGDQAASYKMFTAANGFLIAQKWSRDTFSFMGHVITDTGFTYSFPTFYHKVPGRSTRDNPMFSDGIIWDRQSMNLFTIIDSSTTQFRSTNGGTTWISMPFPRSVGVLRPIAQGYKPGRMIGIRRGASNDLMVTNTYGATWDTLGPHTDRAMYVHEPAADRLWMLVARTSVRPEVNLFDLRKTAQVDTLYFSSDQGKSWQQDLTFTGDTISGMAWSNRDLGYVLGKRDGRTFVARFMPNKADVKRDDMAIFSISASPNPFNNMVALRSTRSGEAVIEIKDVLGRQVSAQKVWFTAQVPLTLPISSGSFNTYILTVRYHDGSSASLKLLHNE